MTREEEIKQARATLKKYGYATDNLWGVEDVYSKFEGCTEEKAQEVLSSVLQNEWLIGEINSSIQDSGEDLGLTPIEEED